MDYYGEGKRRSKIGKVKAFEEMLMKDVPGMISFLIHPVYVVNYKKDELICLIHVIGELRKG